MRGQRQNKLAPSGRLIRGGGKRDPVALSMTLVDAGRAIRLSWIPVE